MQFKVGDRVEVIKPAIGLIDEDQNNLGPGTVTSVVGQEVEVKVDTNDYPWWYHLDKVRPLIPAGAITIIKEDPPTTVADLTTPSITVGTQVRLTGEVVGYDSLAHPERVEVAIEGARTQSSSYVWVKKSALEVIRQPFKRGEVVYPVGDKDSEPRTVVTDEAEGFVLLARHVHGTETLEWDATSFERRP